MDARKYRFFIAALLGVSAAVSAYILAVDEYLWNVDPINHHATGLALFLAGDIVLIVLLFVRLKLGTLLSMLWGIGQIALIGGDVMSGLGLPGYSSKDAFDFLILGKGNVSGIATDALIVLYALVAFLSLLAFLRVRKEAAKAATEAEASSPAEEPGAESQG